MAITRDFNEVFAAELREINRRRGPDEQLPEGAKPSVSLGLTGLALSGGGIRSAAFSLGVVQALARQRMLRHVDYLSTVSGGGYTGSALTVLLDHDRAEAVTDPARFPLRMPSGDDDPPALRHLRNGSSYLTPPGLLSSLRLPTVVLRVMMLGTVMLMPLLLAAVLLTNFFYEYVAPAALTRGVDVLNAVQSAYPAFLTMATFGGLVAFFPFAMSLLRRVDVVGRRRYDYLVAAAFTLSVLLLAAWPTAMAVDYVVVHSTREVRELLSAFAQATRRSRVLQGAAVTALVALVVLRLTGSTVGRRALRKAMMLLAAVGAPGFLFALFLGLCLWQIDDQFILRLSDAPGPDDAAHIKPRLRAEVMEDAEPGTGGPFSVESLTPMSPERPAVGVQDDHWLMVFRVGHQRYYAHRRGDSVRVVPMPSGYGPDPKNLALLLFAFFTLVGTVLLLDVNVTSLHLFYRDQLCNVFLRAERPDGTLGPPGTVALSKLRGTCAPYHLVNATINLTTSTDESLRGRNGDAFLFSRRYVGSEHTGWARTELMERADPNVDVGTAMAISAAAASPNMGTYTSRMVSFLLTLLGARMGYWLPNPARVDDRRRLPPGSLYLLREALGLLDASGAYVNVSDGGHFENLGVYELLRRRCAVIVVADGEEDGALAFGALATLARFAMIDFGVDISIDLSPLRRGDGGHSQAHFAVGKIDYGGGQHGKLVYLKATVTGDENLYVRSYAGANPAFPHEATVDQFFTETQFEVYRALGEHIGRQVWEASGDRREDL